MSKIYTMTSGLHKKTSHMNENRSTFSNYCNRNIQIMANFTKCYMFTAKPNEQSRNNNIKAYIVYYFFIVFEA